jgi:muramoyltetrapeptide carboxypeptidase
MKIPGKFLPGDTIAVIAPSQSGASISQEVKDIAVRRFDGMLLDVVFSKHVDEVDDFGTSSIESRIADLHEAFADKRVRAILAMRGGWSANQLLRYIDWELIKQNPKVFCGFSNITMLLNAIYAKTGLVTYYGPGFSSFGQLKHFEYTRDYFTKCFMSTKPYEILPSKKWSDDNWKTDQENRTLIRNAGPRVIREGSAEGTIVGGCLCDFNLLQGTEYMPSLDGTILFLEDDIAAIPQVFDRELQSLILQPDFPKVRGLVLGRFQKASGMTPELLDQIITSKKELDNIPVIVDADFGHTEPRFTFPIGGTGSIEAKDGKATIRLIKF